MWLTFQEAFFYADNRMVASNNLGCLQTAFDKLIGIFYQVVLRTNVRKTMGMVFHPCRVVRVWEDEA